MTERPITILPKRPFRATPHRWPAILALAAALGFSGCSTSSETAAEAPQASAGVQADEDSLESGTTLQPDDVISAPGLTTAENSGTTTEEQGETGTSDENPSNSGRGLRPIDFPYEIELPARANVEPSCLTRGDVATLVVETKPEAAVAFHAVYWGNEGGSGAPYGKGHGGNDKGQVSPQGQWRSTWVVGDNAPFGKARADVVIGWEGKWGYEHPFFHVAKSAADCP